MIRLSIAMDEETKQMLDKYAGERAIARSVAIRIIVREKLGVKA